MGDMGQSVRVGVVGCGSVLTNYGARLRLLENEGAVEMVAASDVDVGREGFARHQLGDVRFSTDYEDVVAADDVDLVLILTSPPVHGEISIAALEAGKHVLVEKPMAATLEDSARIVELAKQRSLKLVCAPHTILSPTFRIMWKRIHEGDIGKVCLARARYGEGNLFWGSWRYTNAPGGGPLLECGVYNVATLVGLLGPVTRVMAMGGTAIPERVVSGEKVRVEAMDNIQVTLDFGESVFATVATGYTMNSYRSPAVELYGSSGVIQMLGDDWAPEGYELYQDSVGVWQSYAESDPLWHWTEGLPHIVECIRTGTDPVSSPEFAYHVQEVMVKAELSAHTGRAELVESSFGGLDLDADAIEVYLDHAYRVLPGTRWDQEWLAAREEARA